MQIIDKARTLNKLKREMRLTAQSYASFLDDIRDFCGENKGKYQLIINQGLIKIFSFDRKKQWFFSIVKRNKKKNEKI